MEKILIKNSTIYDGTGAHPFQSDILIQNGKILSIGNLKELSDTYVIDGSGLALSPGFIDTHTPSPATNLPIFWEPYNTCTAPPLVCKFKFPDPASST